MKRSRRVTTAMGLLLTLSLVGAATRAGAAVAAASSVDAAASTAATSTTPATPATTTATTSEQIPKMTFEPVNKHSSPLSTSTASASAPSPTHEILQIGRKSKGFG